MTTIVYVSTSYPSFSETFVSAEMEQMLAQGFSVYSYSLRPAPGALRPSIPYIARPVGKLGLAGWLVLGALAWLALPSHRVSLSPASRTLFALAHGLRLRWHIRRVPASDLLVHAHFLARPAEVARYATLRRGRAIVTVHASDSQIPDRRGVESFLHHFAAFRCASRAVEATLLSRHGDLRTFWIPCVIELPQEHVTRPERGGNEIVTVARLVETKGFREMMSAIEMLSSSVENLRWTIVGDGPMRTDLSEWALLQSGKVEVDLVGALPHDETLERLRRAAVFLLLPKLSIDPKSGRWKGDGLPVAIMEAMWLNVPVVVTPIGGIPELVTPETGHVVSGDPASVSRAIHSALENEDSKLIAAARDAIRRDYSPQVTSSRVADLVRRVMIERT